MEVAAEHGGPAILSGTPAAVGGRGPRLGLAAATTTTAARPPAGVTGREQPSPGAQAGADQWEADEREEIPRRGVGDAHLELVQRRVVRVRVPQGARKGSAAEGQRDGARIGEDP